MTRETVAAVLREFKTFRYESSIYGFDLGAKTRLTTGGGIAGQMGAWWIVDKQTGKSERPYALCTKAELRQALREWLAGTRPPARAGYELYARRNRNRFGESYVWSYRRLLGVGR